MVIEINRKIKDIINNIDANKTVKNNAIKIYAALYIMSKRQNKFGYFPVPSEYLMSINKRYSRIIKHFEDSGLILAYKRPTQDDNDIFNVIYKKYYNVSKGICMKYKFLLPTNGDNLDVNMTTNRYFRWYELIQDSLKEYGFEDIKITRDLYGRRVHHSGIRDYKEDFKGYYTIDAIASQPRLLYLDMKNKGIVDENFNRIFENELDFYKEVMIDLRLDSRDDAKELFMHWVNGKGYVPNFKIHIIFPVVSRYIKSYKTSSYKEMGSLLQRIESKIWIDNLYNNVPVDWALPVHDCIIVKEEDADRVYEYCKQLYPDLRFKKSII